MMQQAQAMMANMTPEQRVNMQRMVQTMTPEQRDNMQRMAAGMGMPTPETSAGAGLSATARYEVNGARMLKDEGNALHKAGNHSEALTKYERAISNLASHSSTEALELRTNCELNTAMCYLKLERWSACKRACSQVLASTIFRSQTRHNVAQREAREDVCMQCKCSSGPLVAQ
jgi:hypothetical protein